MPQPTSSIISNILDTPIIQKLFTINPEALVTPHESRNAQDVYRATLRGTPVIVTRIQDLSPYDTSIGVQTLYRIRHPNIVLFLGAGLGTNSIYLVSEYLENGSLRELMELPSLTWCDNLSKLLIDVCRAMMYLHGSRLKVDSNVLTTSNICVSRAWAAKVVHVDSLTHRNYSQEWIAPEVIAGGKSSVRSDLYSLGIILKKIYETYTLPFSMQYLYNECIDNDPCARPAFSMIAQRIEQSKVEVQPEPTLIEL